jgi:hypothetical protein
MELTPESLRSKRLPLGTTIPSLSGAEPSRHHRHAKTKTKTKIPATN